MTINELKSHLRRHPEAELRFQLPDGGWIPVHAHVTEVGRIDKSFIDCGGTVRRESCGRLQAWVADDTDHRLAPGKLAGILDRADGLLGTGDLPVEIEYEDGVVSQFPIVAAAVDNGRLIFGLTTKHTDCLAKEICLPDKTGACGCAPGCC